MKKLKVTFFCVMGLAHLPALALIKPEIEVRCVSAEDQTLLWEMDLVSSRSHPMAGVQLLGLAQLKRGGHQTIFQVRAHPHYDKFTVIGNAPEPSQRTKNQKYSLDLPDSVLNPAKPGTATLEVRTDSDDPFATPTVEVLPLECEALAQH